MAHLLYPCLNIKCPLAVLFLWNFPIFESLSKSNISNSGKLLSMPFSTQGYVLSRLLICTLFNFSIYCLTSFIAYDRLPIPSTTLHEVNASSCFILNTEQEKIEHFCVLYVLYIIFCSFAIHVLQICCIFLASIIFVLFHLPFFSLIHPQAHFLYSSLFSVFMANSMPHFKHDTFMACVLSIWIMMTSWEFRSFYL